MEDIIFNQERIDIFVYNRNKGYYNRLGYDVKDGDKINIPLSDLYFGSRDRVEVICPICNKSRFAEYRGIVSRNHSMCNSCASTVKNTNPDVCECGKKSTRYFNNIPYCDKHYEQIKKHGRILEYSSVDKNKIRIVDDISYIEIRDKNQNFYKDCVVDSNLLKHIENTHWSHDVKHNLIVGTVDGKCVKLHRYVYQCGVGHTDFPVRFIDDDPFNCRLSNLVASDKYLKKNGAVESSDIREVKTICNVEIGIVSDTKYKLLNIRDVYEKNSGLKDIVVEIDSNGCWNCTSHSKYRGGYIQVYMGEKKYKLHREVLRIKLGRDLNSNELTRHMCDNPACCNPNHLEVGSAKDNSDDMMKRGRHYWQNNSKKQYSVVTVKHKKTYVSKEVIKAVYYDYITSDVSQVDLVKKYNLTRGLVQNIVSKLAHCDITDEIDNTTKNTRDEVLKNNILLVKNLAVDKTYTNRDIAMLTGINRETVRRLKNETIYEDIISSIREDIKNDGSGILYVYGIKYDTIVDGVGFRNSVYLSKCNFMCKECHNKESWDIRSGTPYTINELINILSQSDNDITISGGEALLQSKQLVKLVKALKEKDKNIWLYSGNTFESIIGNESYLKVLNYIDVLVDGRFNYDNRQKNPNVQFRGDDSQRIIDVQKSLQKGEVVVCDV